MSNPTEEQIEAAAKVLARAQGVRFDVVPEWLEPYREDARAALVAAAEVQREAAEKAWDACCAETAGQGTVQLPNNPYRRHEGENNGS